MLFKINFNKPPLQLLIPNKIETILIDMALTQDKMQILEI